MLKWILGLAGFMMTKSFIGGMLGYMIGWAIQQPALQAARRRSAYQTMPADLLQDLVTLAMAIARADGHLDQKEIQAIRHFFETRMGFRGEATDWLRDALKAEASTPRDWRSAAERLRGRLRPLERAVVLHLLVSIAMSDGRMDPAEQQMLLQIGQAWGIGPGPEFDAWQRPPSSGKDRTWALGILGLGPNASDKEIERSYKTLVREKHPDKFAHLGEELMQAAHEQFVEIQEAYNILKR